MRHAECLLLNATAGKRPKCLRLPRGQTAHTEINKEQRGSLGCRDSRGWDTWCFPIARQRLQSLSMVTGKSPALCWLCQVSLGPSSTRRTGQPGWVSTATGHELCLGADGVSAGHQWLGQERGAEHLATAGSSLIPSALRYHSADLLTLLLSAVMH